MPAGERFGGRFSLGAGNAPPPIRNRRTPRVGFRARLTYVLPLPLLLGGLGSIGTGNAAGMIGGLGGYAGLTFAAWLLANGIRAEAEYDARAVARPPAIPRKLFAAAAAGAGVVLAAGPASDPAGAIAFGLAAALAHVVAFGLDPMRRKGLEGIDAFQSERVALAVERAESMLGETAGAAGRIGDRRLQGQVERLCDQAREVLRAIELDPRDLGRARAFLNVYLLGLRDATVKFADLYARNRDAVARARYEELIADLGASFSTHRTAMLEDNRGELEIEIEVLRERLNQDGYAVRQ